MPWTFAHPAAILPLKRFCPEHLSFAGLVIGAMSPDLGYYVGRLDMGGETHSLAGIFKICLPTSLALLALTRWLHRPVARLLPSPHREALLALDPPASLTKARALGIAAISVLLGALTHVAWDAFTHVSGYMVVHLAALRTPLFELGQRTFHVYNILQHASTLAGVAILAVSYRRFLRSRAAPLATEGEAPRYALLAILILAALACALPLAHADATHHGATAANVAIMGVHLLVYATSAFAVLLAVTALIAEHRR